MAQADLDLPPADSAAVHVTVNLPVARLAGSGNGTIGGAAGTHSRGTCMDTQLDAEKLDVHRVAVEFQVLAASLLPKGRALLRDQLERARVSIVLNIAEGAGRRSRGEKRRFYSIARGSATECAAVLDLLVTRGLTPADECRSARALLVRVVQMLTKLQQRLGL